MKRSIVHWFAAKVKPRTEKKIKAYLEAKGIEHCILFRDEEPVLPGIVFIRANYEQVLSISAASGLTMSYLYDAASKQFQIIPDKQITDFRFLHQYSDRTFVLPNPENLQGGEKVRVIKGEFAGIEGELYRIKGHKRVVVRVEGLVSLATTYIPKECLERI
ncbi:MAG: Transcription antitermination protein RfaH [Candidatus Ordinivivax streblomastigis]|uniref:Transcription antitermination protein RfaH n=1 Tax=Candidatus Ordinivivax streblomastigis TaxID=2540710 RepID=A0A5M8P5V5_9BACT|nr:MAG: Transcription antitermination protein RfaH [Candidatus Ordinivivax streblomastigis]